MDLVSIHCIFTFTRERDQERNKKYIIKKLISNDNLTFFVNKEKTNGVSAGLCASVATTVTH